MAESCTSSMLSLRCASIYPRTRLMAAGGKPPRACGAGVRDGRLARTSERGRVCRARLAVFRPGLVAAGNDQPRRRVGRVIAPEQRTVSFEYIPQADPGLQVPIVEQKDRTRGAVRAGDALVAIDGQQHGRGAVVWR